MESVNQVVFLSLIRGGEIVTTFAPIKRAISLVVSNFSLLIFSSGAVSERIGILNSFTNPAR